MTERSESERAELTALAEKFESVCGKTMAATLRAAAVQGEPVAWRILCTDKSRGSTGYYYTEQLPFEPGENLRQRSEPVPLYPSPPPAAGWDQAIEACKKVAEKWLESFMGGEVYVARSILNAIEALRHNAPPDSGAGITLNSWNGCGFGVTSVTPDHGGADAGVREALEQSRVIDDMTEAWIGEDAGQCREEFRKDCERLLALSKPAPVDANASAEARLREQVAFYRGMSEAPVYSGKHVANILETVLALSAHPHASDCDKQKECCDLAATEPCADCPFPNPDAAMRGFTDLERMLLIASKAAQNYIANTESELGMTLKSGELLRAAIAKAECYVHASDCDKQGERSGLNTFAEMVKAAADTAASDCDKLGEQFTNCASCDMPRTCRDSKHCAGPSDRTADVTVSELTDILEKLERQNETFEDMAIALLDAFTVGRR